MTSPHERSAKKSPIKRAGSAVAGTTRKLVSKVRPGKRREEEPAEAQPDRMAKKQAASQTRRVTKRVSDVPIDELMATFTPSQTSLKTSFRSDGADLQRDQEFTPGESDRWNDEDHYTNKSGDARIGTHGRSHEPGEQHASAGTEQER